jgi:hypothetical protein
MNRRVNVRKRGNRMLKRTIVSQSIYGSPAWRELWRRSSKIRLRGKQWNEKDCYRFDFVSNFNYLTTH